MAKSLFYVVANLVAHSPGAKVVQILNCCISLNIYLQHGQLNLYFGSSLTTYLSLNTLQDWQHCRWLCQWLSSICQSGTESIHVLKQLENLCQILFFLALKIQVKLNPFCIYWRKQAAEKIGFILIKFSAKNDIETKTLSVKFYIFLMNWIMTIVNRTLCRVLSSHSYIDVCKLKQA